MSPEFDAKFKSLSVNALRIAAGATYFSHGAQKLFGWFGSKGAVELMSRFGAAGVIEVTCGALLIFGLFTRPFALVASGEMAVAYLWMHWGGSGHMWWWDNHGELPLLYSFIWLTYAAFGAGSFSLDAMIAKRKKA
jgi:putative oxidoreductase